VTEEFATSKKAVVVAVKRSSKLIGNEGQEREGKESKEPRLSDPLRAKA
jgi:hypothetical protein